MDPKPGAKNVQLLKSAVENYRTFLKSSTGKSVVFSLNGPASMGVIDALVLFAESLELRIQALEMQMGSSAAGAGPKRS